MPSYVALLRGINVGGKNVIPMAALSKTFERMGLEGVKTYIQSGNVLFQCADADTRAVEARVERALARSHRYDARVVLRTGAEMAALIAGLPRPWRRPAEDTRYYVLFLRHEVDSESILDELAPKPGVETLTYGPGVLYWSAKKSLLGRSSIAKLTSRPIYRQLTVRNLNTTQKLAAMVAQLDER
jgi:uncharacterized protein (DUF1697 family)